MLIILLTISPYSTSTHTNCLIQFVKERLVKSFSSQPRRAFYAFLRACQAFILKFFARNSFNFKHLTRFDLQVAEVNNTAFKNAVNHLYCSWLTLVGFYQEEA